LDIRMARPIHPGEMLREEFMEPLNLTAGKLARAIGVPRTRIERLVREETALTTETATLLARYFRMSEGFWVGLQKEYELDVLHADPTQRARIAAITPLPRPDLDEAA
jgi:antitoxin HigA-1